MADAGPCAGRVASGAVGAALLAMAEAVPAPPAAAGEANAATAFAARMTNNKWREIAALDDVSYRDAYLAGAALSREVLGAPRWAVEVEGQAVRHFGEQGHWEFNGAFVGRWRGFPWSEALPTGVAFGIGPSYATSVPPAEVALDGGSERLLLYWMVELEVGAPGAPVSAVARLHHRSNGYGVFGEEGGSNWIALGLRRRF